MNQGHLFHFSYSDMETQLSTEPGINCVTLSVDLNICTCNKPRLRAVCSSCAQSPAGLSGSVWGAKYMQADGGSVTCRSSRPASVGLTSIDYTPVPSPHLLGKGNMTPSLLGSSHLRRALR